MFSFQSAFVSNYLSETAYLLYHRFLNLSSTFFRIFCDFFGNHLSKPLMFYPINSYWFPLLFQTTYLLYHSFFILSSTFFDFFQNLFCDCRSFQATCLLYHKKSRFVNMEFSTKVALYLRIFLINKYKKADF